MLIALLAAIAFFIVSNAIVEYATATAATVHTATPSTATKVSWLAY